MWEKNRWGGRDHIGMRAVERWRKGHRKLLAWEIAVTQKEKMVETEEKVGGHVKSMLEKMEVTRSCCCTRSFHWSKNLQSPTNTMATGAGVSEVPRTALKWLCAPGALLILSHLKNLSINFLGNKNNWDVCFSVHKDPHICYDSLDIWCAIWANKLAFVSWIWGHLTQGFVFLLFDRL